MSETRDAFGLLLQQLQADMRNLRAAVRSEMASFQGTVRSELSALHTLVSARAEETEKFIEDLFRRHMDRLERRLDQTEKSTEERLARIEARLP